MYQKFNERFVAEGMPDGLAIMNPGKYKVEERRRIMEVQDSIHIKKRVEDGVEDETADGGM